MGTDGFLHEYSPPLSAAIDAVVVAVLKAKCEKKKGERKEVAVEMHDIPPSFISPSPVPFLVSGRTISHQSPPLLPLLLLPPT